MCEASFDASFSSVMKFSETISTVLITCKLVKVKIFNLWLELESTWYKGLYQIYWSKSRECFLNHLGLKKTRICKNHKNASISKKHQLYFVFPIEWKKSAARQNKLKRSRMYFLMLIPRMPILILLQFLCWRPVNCRVRNFVYIKTKSSATNANIIRLWTNLEFKKKTLLKNSSDTPTGFLRCFLMWQRNWVHKVVSLQ